MLKQTLIVVSIITMIGVSVAAQAASETKKVHKYIQKFKQLDSNQDKALSIEEFSNQAIKGESPSAKQIKKKKKRFNKIDVNKDKKITSEEYLAYQAKQTAKNKSKNI